MPEDAPENNQISYVQILPEGTYFCFKSLKKEIDNITTEEGKILYLLKAKTHYLQEIGKILEHKNSPTFEERIDFEMEFIKLRYEVRRNYAEETRSSPAHHFIPIRINCNVNQLGDLFYQILNETKVNNKPFMETTIVNLARIICSCFVDKDEKELSVETLKTILSKSHPEKRPKHGDRVVIK